MESLNRTYFNEFNMQNDLYYCKKLYFICAHSPGGINYEKLYKFAGIMCIIICSMLMFMRLCDSNDRLLGRSIMGNTELILEQKQNQREEIKKEIKKLLLEECRVIPDLKREKKGQRSDRNVSFLSV